MEQRIQADTKVKGIFYRGMDRSLLFSVEVKDHPEINYAEIPEWDAKCRTMAEDTGQPLKQWVLNWNDVEIERDRLIHEELVQRGLAFTFTAESVNSDFYDSMLKATDRFLESVGADMKPD